MLQNEDSIQPKLDSLTSTHKNKYQWLSYDDKYYQKGMHWNLLLYWEYHYPIISLNDKYLGTIIVNGSFYNNHELFYNLLIRVGLFILFFISLVITLFPLSNRIPKQLFITPIHKILALLRSDSNTKELLKIENLPEEIDEIYLKISQLLEDTKRHSQEIALGQIATQVAHDIRSPLLVLKRILNNVPGLPEKSQTDVNSALQRVTDIANNLLSQHEKKEELVNASALPTYEYLKLHIESIISEKNIQIMGLNIRIEFTISANAHGCFAMLDSASFKRVLSNLINNSIEAINKLINRAGVIQLNLGLSNDQVCITIQDNGCGIPEDRINTVLEEGVSYGKSEGHGLGLSYAIQKIQDWNGDFFIKSEEGVGTCFKILLPQSKPAPWFQPELTITPDTLIVILDDENYIHEVWDERFSQDQLLHNIRVKHFYNIDKFSTFCSAPINHPVIYLIDYELGDKKNNGLSLIKNFNITSQSILVTSCYDHSDIVNAAQKIAVKIIPKPFSEFIAITVTTQSTSVLIDDDDLICRLWQDSAEQHGLSLDIYHEPDDFMKKLNIYPKSTTIYLDSCIGKKKGEDYAKTLYYRGYRSIFLATGYPKEQFKHVTWVIDILPKDPPW